MFAFPPVRGTQLISGFTGVVVGDGAVGKVRRRERTHPSPAIFMDILSFLRRVFLYLIRPMHSLYVLPRTLNIALILTTLQGRVYTNWFVPQIGSHFALLD
jgi:hypothetical protein